MLAAAHVDHAVDHVEVTKPEMGDSDHSLEDTLEVSETSTKDDAQDGDHWACLSLHRLEGSCLMLCPTLV